MAYNIPWFEITLNSGSSVPVAYWRKYGTESTTLSSMERYILTPASTLSGIKSWEWWGIGSILVPTDHPSATRTYTLYDWHNSSQDVGPGGIGWGFGNLVSPLFFGFTSGSDRLFMNVEPNYPNHQFTLIPTVTRNSRIDFVTQIIWGRLDQQLGLAGPGVSGGGIGSHPNNGYGRIRVWINGSDTPVDTGNINTLQRSATGGTTYTQTVILGPWDGYYGYGGSSLPATAKLRVAATRIGRSFGESAQDGSNGFTLVSELLAAGSASDADLSDLSSDDIVLPPSLTGGSSPPPTPTSHFGRWTDSVQWNAGVIAGEPETPPTVNEQHLGRWSSYVEWNAAGAANILIAP